MEIEGYTHTASARSPWDYEAVERARMRANSEHQRELERQMDELRSRTERPSPAGEPPRARSDWLNGVIVVGVFLLVVALVMVCEM